MSSQAAQIKANTVLRLGFVGLGVQGAPLARNLLAAGHALRVFDVRAAAVQSLVEAGAIAAATLAEVGTASDIVLVCVVNDEQVRAVLMGTGALLETLAPGSIVVVHSTVAPQTILRLAEQARDRGVRIVDAPVSGGARGAAAKQMSYMLGGDDEAVAACKPILRISGDRITHVGPTGSAAIAKLVHQVVLCGNMMAISEGMRLGEAAGLGADVIRKIVGEGWAQSRIAEIWGPPMTEQTRTIFYKDLRLALELGENTGAPLPATAVCQQMLAEVLPCQPKEADA